MLDARECYERLRREVGKVIKGQETAIRDLIIAFFAKGHVLLEGVPGVAKTLLARSFARSLDLQYGRVQFTPDLMPSDLVGTNVFDPREQAFVFHPGPIFTEVLLGDEINRTPPKTQAALLEAMEEGTVTVDGKAHRLSEHFFVVATQNPVEYEGTYPLPEAELDRFLMKVRIDYPTEEAEMDVLRLHESGFDPHDLDAVGFEKVADAAAIEGVRAAAGRVRIEESVRGYVLAIVRRSRESQRLRLGASPRAAVALLRVSRTLAALEGKEFLTPDDVKSVARPVLRHRLVLDAEAEVEGYRAEEVVEEILSSVPVPR